MKLIKAGQEAVLPKLVRVMMVFVTIGSKPPGLVGFLERLKERQEDLINWTLSPILTSVPPSITPSCL